MLKADRGSDHSHRPAAARRLRSARFRDARHQRANPRRADLDDRLRAPAAIALLQRARVRLLAPVGWLAGADREDIERFVAEEQNLGELAGVGALVLFVVPTIISTASRLWEIWPARGWLLQRLRISPTHRTQTAWDHFYSQRQPALVRLTLADGRVVGGYYGEDSLAAYGEQAGDLYLQQRWVLDDDDWFVEPAPGTLGLWVAADDIVSFELYAPPAGRAGEADT